MRQGGREKEDKDIFKSTRLQPIKNRQEVGNMLKESLASKGELGKAAAKSFGFRLTDGERDGASVVEGLGDDARLHIFHYLHHIVHHRVSEGVGDFLLHQPCFYLAMLYGVSSSCTISHDKSASAEVYIHKLS